MSDDAMQILLSNESILEFMTRAAFYGSRSDIVHEARGLDMSDVDEHFLKLSTVGMNFVNRSLVIYTDNKDKLYEIGMMPVAVGRDRGVGEVSVLGDGQACCPFMLGLIDLTKMYSDKKFEEKKSFFVVLLQLVNVGGECINEQVISTFIEVAANTSSRLIDGTNNALILSKILDIGDKDTEDDVKRMRWAAAIDTGVFELILNLIIQHGDFNGGQLKPNEEGQMLQSVIKMIQCSVVILQSDEVAQLSPTTEMGEYGGAAAEALAGRRKDLVETFKAAESTVPQNQNCLTLYAELTKIIVGPVEEKVSCANCAVELDKGRRQRCNICKIPYCSRDCQVADWKKGHKKECKNIAEKNKEEEAAREEAEKRILDGSTPEDSALAMRAKIDAGIQLLEGNTLRFRMLAVAMGCDIRDCVCTIDTRSDSLELKCMPVGEFQTLLHSHHVPLDQMYKKMEESAGSVLIAILLENEGVGMSVVFESTPYEDLDSIIQPFKTNYPQDPMLQVELMEMIQKADTHEKQMTIVQAVIQGKVK